MLTAIMWLFGIDLEQKILLLRRHVQDAVEETSVRFRRELQEAGLFVIFAGLGTVALAGAMGTASAALFLWLDQQYGAFVALAAVGGLCTLFAAAMFVFAMARGRNHKGAVRGSEAPAPYKPLMPSAMQHRAQPAPPPISIPPLPENATLVDRLAHRFGQHALAASDEAVVRAEQLMREGSSGALLTALALAAAVGFVIGRRGGLPSL
jgi:hypothetical protein